MVKKFFKILKREISGVHEAAYLLGLFSFLSLILGLVRDRLFAGVFGAGQILDAYYSAFKIPDTIFVSVASLVSASVLVPFLINRQDDKEKTKKFINSIFSVFGGLIVIFCGIVFLFTDQIVGFIFRGFEVETLKLTIFLTKLMLIQPIILGASAFLSSIIQAKQRFFSYALAPVLYNGGIIIGVIWLYPVFGVVGLALGVILGSILHLIIQLPSLGGLEDFPKITFKPNWLEVKEVFKISLPRTLTLSISHISTLGLIAIGASAGVGAISVFNFGWNIQSAPLSMIAGSYSMAAFPVLSKLFHEKDINKYLNTVANSLRHIAFWVIPIVILFIVLRAQIVRSVLGFGEFDWQDTRLTSAILAVFAVSILAQSFIVLLVRAYYASAKTITPLVVNVFFALLAIVFAFVFKKLILTSLFVELFLKDLLRLSGIENIAVLALPLGFSLAMILNVGVLLYCFKKDFPTFYLGVGKLIREHIGASLSGGFVTYFALYLIDPYLPNDKVWGVFSSGLIAGTCGIFVIILILSLVKNQEFLEFKKNLTKKIFKASPIGSDETTA